MKRSKAKATIDVNRKSIKDILSMDLYGLNARDTRNLANRLVSAANKRVRYLENDKKGIGQSSPMYQYIKERGVFSVRGKTRSQIMSEIKDMRFFLLAKSSTVRGWSRIRKNVETRLSQKLSTKSSKVNIKLSNEEYKNLWSSYELMKDYRDPKTLKKIFGDSGKAQAFAYQVEQRMPYADEDDKRSYIAEVINRMELDNTRNFKKVMKQIEKENENENRQNTFTTVEESEKDSNL